MFNIPSSITYLNTAAASLKLKESQTVLTQALKQTQKPWKKPPELWLKDAHRLADTAADFFGGDPKRCALVPSVNYGMEMISRWLPSKPSQTLILIEDEFPSQRLPWQALETQNDLKIKRASLSTPLRLTDQLLTLIDAHTSVLITPLHHWITGEAIDIATLRAALPSEAWLVVDATQSAGVLPINCKTMGIDVLMCSSHKWMLGTPGLTYLYVSQKLDPIIKPLESHWTSLQSFPGLNDRNPIPAKGVRKLFAGQVYSPYHLALAELGLKTIIDWDFRFSDALEKISQALIWTLRSAGITVVNENKGLNHIVCVKDESGTLASQLERHRIIVSQKGPYVRFSAYIYNSPKDIKRLERALLSRR